jgi:hypothetical protein
VISVFTNSLHNGCTCCSYSICASGTSWCITYYVATPLWAKCEGEAHTPKSGNLESSGTPENLEFELKGQNTSHWGVLNVIGKVLKCRCLNWPCIGHLDICSPSYGPSSGFNLGLRNASYSNFFLILLIITIDIFHEINKFWRQFFHLKINKIQIDSTQQPKI